MAHAIPKIVYDAGAGDVTINFDYPPISFNTNQEQRKPVQKVSAAANGAEQTVVNYSERLRSLEFRQVSDTILNLLTTALDDHLEEGGSFKYFEDKADTPFFTYTLQKGKRGLKPIRTSATPNKNKFKLFFRRVV